MPSPEANTIPGLFERLHVWERRGQRAPSKPLLALWSIGRCINGQPRFAPFQVVDMEVGELIREFGPSRTRIHPEYPFWRLQNDGVWEVVGAQKVRLTRSGDPFRSDLFDPHVRGGFLESIYVALREDVLLSERIAYSLARAHFPSTRYEDVLEAVGIRPRLIPGPGASRYVRDPEFRRVVLRAYNFGCALCGFAVRLGEGAVGSAAPIALDAAHIKWHQARGPARVQNGMALCALHHRLFDSGAFTLAPDLTVIVAESASGSGSGEWLWRFAERPLPAVLPPASRPAPTFVRWHQRNVFKGSVGLSP